VTGEARERGAEPAPRPRVVVVGEDGTWFRRDYERAFAEAGFEPRFVPTEAPSDLEAPDPLARSRRRVRGEMLDLVREREPALVFCYAYDRTLDAETRRAVRALPCPSVLLHVDMEGQWFHVVRSCGAFTLVAAAQPVHLAPLRARGARVVWWPMAGFASDPDWTAPRAPAVRFVGAPAEGRARALLALRDAGVPIEVFGRWARPCEGGEPAPSPPRRGGALGRLAERARRGGHALPALAREEGLAGLVRRARRVEPDEAPAGLEPFLRGPVPDGALSAALGGAQVTLGCSETSAGPGARMMRLRDFEAPLSGACYLTQRSAGLDRCFRVGEEVLAWESHADLAATARALLDDPARCLALARAGHARARREHTYAARIATLLDLLGAAPPA
jgi:hypothetical protein